KPYITLITIDNPYNKNKNGKFMKYKDDAFEVKKHIGLIETPQAKDKKQLLLDVWFDRIKTDNSFCVETEIEAEDEWLHSFYYFNEEIPSDECFEETIADYLTFELDMVLHGRIYLFEQEGDLDE